MREPRRMDGHGRQTEPLEELLARMYRLARTARAAAFPAQLMTLLCARCGCECAAMGTWHDGRFVGSQSLACEPDRIEGLDRQWADIGRPQLEGLMRRGAADSRDGVYADPDDPRLGGAVLQPVRSFMSRIETGRGAVMVVDLNSWGHAALLWFMRPGRMPPIDGAVIDDLCRLAPHVSECISVSYVLSLASERSPMSRRPMAVFDCRGHVVLLTTRFVELLEEALGSAFSAPTEVPRDWLEAARRGSSLVLGRGALHLSFKALEGCWMAEAHRTRAVLLLSGREYDVAARYVQGLTHKDIARQLAIAPNTVRVHVQRIFSKTNVASRQALREWMRAMGMG